MGATRDAVMKLLKLHDGCSYQFSPDRFDRGERVITCGHGRVFRVSAVVKPVEYNIAEMVEEEGEGDDG